MIGRDAAKTLASLAAGYPVVAVTGPRQSGKTTLVRAVFPGHAYTSLENPAQREFAESDPTDPSSVFVPVLMRALGNSPRGVSEGGA